MKVHINNFMNEEIKTAKEEIAAISVSSIIEKIENKEIKLPISIILSQMILEIRSNVIKMVVAEDEKSGVIINDSFEKYLDPVIERTLFNFMMYNISINYVCDSIVNIILYFIKLEYIHESLVFKEDLIKNYIYNTVFTVLSKAKPNLVWD